MNINFKLKLIKNLLYLNLAALLIGFVKVEFFLDFIPDEILSITRVVSYVTLGISIMFFYLIIGLSLTASFYTLELIKLGKNFNANRFYFATKPFVWCLVLNETSKLIITLLTFNEFENFTSENSYKEALHDNTLWFHLTNGSDLVFISMGVLFFAFSLQKKKQVNVTEAVFTSIPLCLPFIIFRLF